jgi:hypothetical protein
MGRNPTATESGKKLGDGITNLKFRENQSSHRWRWRRSCEVRNTRRSERRWQPPWHWSVSSAGAIPALHSTAIRPQKKRTRCPPILEPLSSKSKYTRSNKHKTGRRARDWGSPQPDAHYEGANRNTRDGDMSARAKLIIHSSFAKPFLSSVASCNFHDYQIRGGRYYPDVTRPVWTPQTFTSSFSSHTLFIHNSTQKVGSCSVSIGCYLLRPLLT